MKTDTTSELKNWKKKKKVFQKAGKLTLVVAHTERTGVPESFSYMPSWHAPGRLLCKLLLGSCWVEPRGVANTLQPVSVNLSH